MRGLAGVVALLLLTPFRVSLHAQAAPRIPADISEVTSGGSWRGSGREGSYRIIIQTDGFEHIVSRAWLQWISGPDAHGDSLRVVASVELQEVGGGGWQAHSPRIFLTNGSWEATMEGANSHFDPIRKARWRLKLGPPGEYSMTETPAAPNAD